MRGRAFLVGAVVSALALLAAALVVRVLDRHAPTPAGRVDDGTRALLDELQGRVLLTWFGSARQAMPPSYQQVEDRVRAAFRALQAAAPDRVDWRIVDPEADPAGRLHAASKRCAPVTVRAVRHDEASETRIWSAIAIACDRHPEAVIHHVGPKDLPHLEALVVANLRGMLQPRQPVVAVAAPLAGYRTLRGLLPGLLGEGALPLRVVDVDFDATARLPAEADLLLWLAPSRATRAHHEALARFLASGRTVVVGVGGFAPGFVARADGGVAFTAAPAADVGPALAPFGVAVRDEMLLDRNSAAIERRFVDGSRRPVQAPFQVRIAPAHYDTKSMAGTNAGNLLLDAVSPLAFDRAVAAAAGRRVEIVATTSDQTRLCSLPGAEFTAADLEAARAVPKQPWCCRLVPVDPWHGELFVVGSAGLWHDDVLAQPNHANAAFLRTLVRTGTDPGRLARLLVERPAPPELPALSLRERLWWRGFGVFAVPAGLLAMVVLRRRAAGAGRPRALRRAFAAPAAVAAAFGLFAIWPDAASPGLDLTAERAHRPAPELRALLADAGDLRVELVLSERGRMPGPWKGLERRLVARLQALGLRPRLLRPEDLPPPARAALADAGIAPFDAEAVADDAPASTRITSGLRLVAGERTAVVPRLDLDSEAHLEFLLAAALRRLGGAAAPTVAVLADYPRLSPAEVHDLQQRGFTAPEGADVYRAARDLLERYGYRTVYVNPNAPVLPPDLDVLVWLQPRFSARVLPQVGALLARGGRVLVASQHFNVQQRQYVGTGFTTVYWPQPQYSDVDDYLRLLGVRQIGNKIGDQPGEVLFDRQHARLALPTWLHRSNWREQEHQEVALPFLIRVAGAGLSRRSPLTQRLGALLLPWASRYAIDDALLAQHGLRHEVLATTSDRCWTYAWSGGFLPPESFVEPPPERRLPGPQPLAVQLAGRFPSLEQVEAPPGGRPAWRLGGVPDHGGEGRLLLVGCSELWKNDGLSLPGYDHAQFLLNAVADLAHPPALAALQARRAAPRALEWQPPATRLGWRAVVTGLPPLLFLAVGLMRRRWRGPSARAGAA
jgi:hypothetical protein